MADGQAGVPGLPVPRVVGMDINPKEDTVTIHLRGMEESPVLEPAQKHEDVL